MVLYLKINGNSQLGTAYNNQNDELGLRLKLFFGLPFIPCMEIKDAFEELMSICPSPIGHIFSDYILSNYKEPNALFPSNLWASRPTLNPRYVINNIFYLIIMYINKYNQWRIVIVWYGSSIIFFF